MQDENPTDAAQKKLISQLVVRLAGAQACLVAVRGAITLGDVFENQETNMAIQNLVKRAEAITFAGMKAKDVYPVLVVGELEGRAIAQGIKGEYGDALQIAKTDTYHAFHRLLSKWAREKINEAERETAAS